MGYKGVKVMKVIIDAALWLKDDEEWECAHCRQNIPNGNLVYFVIGERLPGDVFCSMSCLRLEDNGSGGLR